MIGSACPCAAEGEITARCALVEMRVPSSELRRAAYLSSAFQHCAEDHLFQGCPWGDCCCPKEDRGDGCGD